VYVTRAEKLILCNQINAWDGPVSEYVEASMAVQEQLQMQKTDFHGDGIFKPMPRW
jgi:cobalamin biosynthesis protein CobD/CbiB